MIIEHIKTIDVEQGSDEWHELRWGCVTGTRMKQAVGARYSKKNGWTLGDTGIQQNLLCEIVSEMQSIQEIEEYESNEMLRGKELEPHSVKAASQALNVKLVKCGMLQSTVYPNFRLSPDAVCYDNGIVVGGYETKSKAGKKHIEYLLDNCVPDDHLWQCLAPMIMSDCVKWWAFGHYDDRNTVNPLFLKILMREDYADLITQARQQLSFFLKEVEKINNQLRGVNNG